MNYTGFFNINIQQVQAFLAVAEYENMTRAADRLNVTQPLISQRVNALEENLGIRLFARVKGRLKISPAGKYLYREWRGILATMEKAVEEAHIIAKQETDLIRVGFEFSMSPEHLLEFAGELYKCNPEISMQIESASDLRGHLINRDLDVIYMVKYDSNEKSPEIIDIPIKKKKFMVIASKEFKPFADKKTLEWTDLKGMTIFCEPPTKTGHYEQQLNYMCKKNGFSPRIITCTNLFNAQINMTLGRGVVVGCQYSVDLNSGLYNWFELEGATGTVVMSCLRDTDSTIIDFTKAAAGIIRNYI